MEWIDVNEKLPPLASKSVQGSIWVLGVIVDDYENQIVAEVRHVSTPKKPFWEDVFDNKVYVSHWMELPQPPIFYAE